MNQMKRDVDVEVGAGRPQGDKALSGEQTTIITLGLELQLRRCVPAKSILVQSPDSKVTCRWAGQGPGQVRNSMRVIRIRPELL